MAAPLAPDAFKIVGRYVPFNTEATFGPAYRPLIEEGVMVLILIDTNTGERRTIMVPVRKGPEPASTAAVLTHPRFAERP